MKTLSNLFCKSAQSMTPYSPIEPPDQIARRLGINEEDIVKLDANENPFGTSQEVINALSQEKYYHIYPDPAQVQLREAIAQYANCEADMVIAGTGADEIIDIVCRLLLEPGEEVISFTPTFSYYSHVIALNKGQFVDIPREDDYSISLEKVKQINLERCKLVILCSPNNPSGNLLEEEVLDYFLAQNVIVMLDEAYYEFSGKTYLDKISDHPNLIVLRTFSKCFGLAGMRVGYGIGQAELIGSLMKIKPPFSVSVAAEVALKSCLKNLPIYQQQVSDIIQIRDEAIKALNGFEQLEVSPSQSNFILCRVSGYDAETLCKDLEKLGILVRYFKTEQLKNFIRISVGTAPQMELLINKLRLFIQ